MPPVRNHAKVILELLKFSHFNLDGILLFMSAYMYFATRVTRTIRRLTKFVRQPGKVIA